VAEQPDKVLLMNPAYRRALEENGSIWVLDRHTVALVGTSRPVAGTPSLVKPVRSY
jgi:hypothetical protein